MKIIFTKHIEMIEEVENWYEIYLTSWKSYCFTWENIKNCVLIWKTSIFTIEDYISPLKKENE